MTRLSLSPVLLGIGWLGLVLALIEGQSFESFGLVLGTVIIAECLSDIIAAPIGSDQKGRSDVVGYTLFGWLILSGAIVFSFQIGQFDFFQDQPFAALCMLGLVLVLGLLKLPQNHVGSKISAKLVSFRWMLCAAVVVLLNMSGAGGGDIIIASIMMVNLILLLMNAEQLLRQPIGSSRLEKGWMVYLFQYVDILIMFSILSKEQAMTYLFARSMSMIIATSLGYLSSAAAMPLLRAYRLNEHTTFISMAARLNLGFLLIGGGLALAVLNIGPPVGARILPTGTDFNTILGWLVLGVSAPVFFGGTRFLLTITGNGSVGFLIEAVATVLLVAAVLSSASPTDVFVAQCMAIVHLVNAAVAALFLVGRAGIWPGLTALLMRQIRLR